MNDNMVAMIALRRLRTLVSKSRSVTLSMNDDGYLVAVETKAGVESILNSKMLAAIFEACDGTSSSPVGKCTNCGNATSLGSGDSERLSKGWCAACQAQKVRLEPRDTVG